MNIAQNIILLSLGLLIAIPSIGFAQWTEVKRLVQEADKRKAESDSLLALAYKMAKVSVARTPSSAEEHLWLANAAGRLAQSKNGREKIELSKVVKRHAEQAIQLDPNLAAAHMTLGAWHFYVADLTWIEKNLARMLYEKLPDASYEKAIEHLTLAINGKVEFILESHYIRALAYDELDKETSARADFKAVLSLKPRNAKERTFQQEAREWLE